MELIDQHLHSEFSFDSTEPLANYLKQHPGHPIVTTEHLDFANPVSNFQDDVPDYAAYQRVQQQLNQPEHRVYRGIEIGYTPATEPKINAYLAQYPVDLKLLSVHQNGQYDYLQPIVLTLPVADVIHDYYERLIQALESSVPADILAHFDYGLRQLTVTPSLLARTASDQLDRVVDLTCQRHLAFELNTKSMYRYGNLDLYDYVIEKYLAHGGKRFTLGSDAHDLSHYADHFDEARQLLLRKGVTHIDNCLNGQRVSLLN